MTKQKTKGFAGKLTCNLSLFALLVNGADLASDLSYINHGNDIYGINMPENVYEVEYDIDLPDDYLPISSSNHNLEELSHVEKVTITPEVADLSAVNYMTNVEEITIDAQNVPFDMYKTIDGKVFNKPVVVKISGRASLGQYFNEQNYGFLKDIPEITKLVIGDDCDTLVIDNDFLNSLTNVRNLEINVNEYSNFNCGNLTFLDSLYIKGLPYDVAVYVSNEDIENLKQAGVDVDGNNMHETIDINNKIDEIAKSLDITDDMSDKEKLNKVISWILNNYQYDPEIAAYNENNIFIPFLKYAPFYGKGFLYGSLNGETQICGNYAAMANVLLDRVGIESYMIYSLNHAWNIVKVDGEYYALDTTILDQFKVIKKGLYKYVIDENGERIYLTKEEYEAMQNDDGVYGAYTILDEQTSAEVFETGNQELIDKFKDEGYLMNVNYTNARYIPLPFTCTTALPLDTIDYNELYDKGITDTFIYYSTKFGLSVVALYMLSKVLEQELNKDKYKQKKR